MGFKDWIKGNFSTEEKKIIEKLSEDKLANEKWIENYFKIGFEKAQKESKESFAIRIDKTKNAILSLILGNLHLGNSVFKKDLKKSVTIKVIEPEKEHYEFLIRFSDFKEEDFKDNVIRWKKNGKAEDYLFSPLQTIIINEKNILPNIEAELMQLLKIKPTEQMKSNTIMKLYSFVNNEPHYTEFDGIQYFAYPVKKRIELYVKNPKLERATFPMVERDYHFNEFIEEIMSKKEHNEHMKKYCKAVEGLLIGFRVGKKK